jgi:hypothetical protein
MGIFANRLIKKDEELTFNYNVDRYGCVEHSPCNIDSANQLLPSLPLDTRHSLAIAANLTAWVSSAERLRQILLAWMIYISMVRPGSMEFLFLLMFHSSGYHGRG